MASEGTVRLTHVLLGAVNDTAVKIFVRANDASVVVADVWRLEDQEAGRVDLDSEPEVTNIVAQKPHELGKATDFTGVVVVDTLAPSTRYGFRVRLADDMGTPRAGVARIVSHGSFRTLESPGAVGHLRFGYGSCLCPFVYGQFDTFDAIRPHELDFMMLLGDQVYVDVPVLPAGFPDAYTDELYVNKYREAFNDPYLARFGMETPLMMIWDDHELINNFNPASRKTNMSSIVPQAERAYLLYEHAHNPDPVRPGGLYYTFATQGAAFFVLDTRTFRGFWAHPDEDEVLSQAAMERTEIAVDAVDADLGREPAAGVVANTSDSLADMASAFSAKLHAKTVLGQAQLSDLFDWLLESQRRGVAFKFIVSSIMVFGTTAHDSWPYYAAAERHRIMRFCLDQGITGVVFLSGDQHWQAVYKVLPFGPDGPTFMEFSNSPLGAFHLANKTQPVQPHPDWSEGKKRRSRADVERFAEDEFEIVYVADTSDATFAVVDVQSSGAFGTSTLTVNFFEKGTSEPVFTYELSEDATHERFFHDRRSWVYFLSFGKLFPRHLHTHNVRVAVSSIVLALLFFAFCLASVAHVRARRPLARAKGNAYSLLPVDDAHVE